MVLSLYFFLFLFARRGSVPCCVLHGEVTLQVRCAVFFVARTCVSVGPDILQGINATKLVVVKLEVADMWGV